MNARVSASVKTLWKYLFWTAVSAVATGAVEHVGDLNIPAAIIPLVAAVLKAIATYAATEKDG